MCELGDQYFNGLGVCYYQGKGVQKDMDEAQKLWEMAAQQGQESAKKSLDSLNEGAQRD